MLLEEKEIEVLGIETIHWFVMDQGILYDKAPKATYVPCQKLSDVARSQRTRDFWNAIRMP